jgi:hypothetical protein
MTNFLQLCHHGMLAENLFVLIFKKEAPVWKTEPVAKRTFIGESDRCRFHLHAMK